MPLLDLKVMEDIIYPEEDRQSVSNLLEQGWGVQCCTMGCTERVFPAQDCVQGLTAEDPSAGTAEWCGCTSVWYKQVAKSGWLDCAN